MKISKIRSESRRDFVAVMVCEHCGHEAVNDRGYHDIHYHTRVIPRMGCPNCKLDRTGSYADSFHPGHIPSEL